MLLSLTEQTIWIKWLIYSTDFLKFYRTYDDPIKTTLKRENKIKTFLKELKNTNIIDYELYKLLAFTSSWPGVLYGLLEITQWCTHMGFLLILVLANLFLFFL